MACSLHELPINPGGPLACRLNKAQCLAGFVEAPLRTAEGIGCWFRACSSYVAAGPTVTRRQRASMRPLTFHMLASEVASKTMEAMPDWWRRIDEDPSWRSYSECVPYCHRFATSSSIARPPDKSTICHSSCDSKQDLFTGSRIDHIAAGRRGTRVCSPARDALAPAKPFGSCEQSAACSSLSDTICQRSSVELRSSHADIKVRA